MVRRCLDNWIQVGRSLRGLEKSSRSNRLFDLRFKTGVNIDHVIASNVGPLLFYCDFAQRLRIFSNHDLKILASIAEDIQRKLNSKFTPVEVEKWATGGNFSKHSALLFLTVRKFAPSVVVETGVAQGISSYVILQALQINGKGKLISIDLPNRNPEGYINRDGTCDSVYTPNDLEPGWLVPSELRTSWKPKLGRSSEVLPTIENDVDIFYHDSEHSYQNMSFEYEWAYNHLKEGGILASDDVDWNQAFFDFSRRREDMRPLFDQSVFPSLIKTRI
jgi:predicted O-methyltransferase YrrM